MQIKFLFIFLLYAASLHTLGAAITKFDFLGTNPNLSTISNLSKVGSQIELILDLDADKGLYTIEAFRNSNLNEVVSKLQDFEHDGGNVTKYLRVPLVEGSNDYFLRILETSVAGGIKTTNTVLSPINRDLQFSVSSVRLNHIEALSEVVPLYTKEKSVNLYYTVNGSSEQFEVAFFRNFNQISTVTIQGSGNYSETSFPIETGLNLLQIKVKSLDLNGNGLGIQKESNIINVIHDGTEPTLLATSTTFQTNPPPTGIWGPTDLASIGLIIETDQPYARVEILNTRNGDLIQRFAEASGRLVVGGIELPKEPTLGPLGITTTTYGITIFDEAGNFDASDIVIERLSLEPCFTLLKMEPGDSGFISNGESLNVVGAVCEEQKPHRVEFSLASRFSQNSFFKDEQLANLMGGELFNKDIAIPVDVAQPGQNVEISVQAVVYTTNPVDPRLEVASPAHDLGVIILDNKPPAAPSINTEKVVFATNSPTLTIDGLIEREASVTVNITEPFLVRPSRTISEQNRQFRSVLDLGFVADGEYVADIIQRDKAGNIGIGSSSKVILKYDRRSPQVKSVRINNSSIEQSRPFFFNAGDTIKIQVLMDEYMAGVPKVWVTQQGGYAVEAGLGQTISDGFEFEYQYVVLPSQDGDLDGPVEVLVTDGSDNAGNTVNPSHRESQAFVVDTLAPVLNRRDISPKDGSVLNSVPKPLRLVMREHPQTKGGEIFGSGPDPENVRVEAFGPLESNPNRLISGRLEIFGPRTVDFYPDSNLMNLDGTYLFQIHMTDQVGNTFVESVILNLDQEKLSTSLILETIPEANSFYNFATLPRKNGVPLVSFAMEPSLTQEMNLTSTQVEVFNYLRRPQKFQVSQPVLSSSSSIEVTFEKDVLQDGSDDGVFTAVARLIDTAGNLSDEFVYSYYYDSQAPQVLDGLHFPVPQGYTGQDYRYPRSNSVVNGPLDVVSAILFDKKSSIGFLGSGINTSIVSSATMSSTTIVLSLEQSFGSQPVGEIITGMIKFKGDLSQGAPIYGGPLLSRVLFEINVDPMTQIAQGLPVDGSFDGIYKMQVFPVDMSQNAGDISTAYFLYDTQKPVISIDVLNEVWITSGVISLSGSAQDTGAYPLVTAGFGSTKGTGVRTVEIRIDSVNEYGSSTFPAILEWTSLDLGKNPIHFGHNELFNFQFNHKFRNFDGKVRVTARAIDQAGNVGINIRDIGLDSESLSEPTLLTPIDGLRIAGGIQKFRWSPIAKASGYKLELIDTSNNIHNYDFGPGIIEADINLDPFPEGKVIWKILVIDGNGNANAVQNGRELIIDRQKPEVVSMIIEDPVLFRDQSGRVLKTQVRVNIKFSESIDPLSPLDLRFLPAPKHYFNSVNQHVTETYPAEKLQVLDIKADQVTAMFFIEPSDSNADYNGIGRLIGSGCRDITGIDGDDFSLDFELDLGPYFDLRVFSNPIREQELVFIIKGLHHKGGSTEAIAGSPYTVVRQSKDFGQESSDDRIQVIELNRLNLTTFQGTYPIDLALSGSLRFEITGSDEQGNTGTRIIPFEVTRLLYFDEPLRESISKVSEFMTEESEPEQLFRVKFPWMTSSENTGQIWNMFPRTSLSRAANFSIDLNDLSLLPGKYAVMEPGNSVKLNFLTQSRVDNQISFKTTMPHKVVLIKDEDSPEINFPDLDLLNLSQDLVIKVDDSGVGLDLSKSSVTVDGKEVSGLIKNQSEFQLSVSELSPLKSQNLAVNAADYLGNSITKSVQVKVAGSVRIESALVVPNPSSGSASLNVSLNRDVQSYQISIYDISGKILSKFEGGNILARSQIALDSYLPPTLANGVYIIKLKVVDSSNRIDKKMVKFVILK